MESLVSTWFQSIEDFQLCTTLSFLFCFELTILVCPGFLCIKLRCVSVCLHLVCFLGISCFSLLVGAPCVMFWVLLSICWLSWLCLALSYSHPVSYVNFSAMWNSIFKPLFLFDIFDTLLDIMFDCLLDFVWDFILVCLLFVYFILSFTSCILHFVDCGVNVNQRLDHEKMKPMFVCSKKRM